MTTLQCLIAFTLTLGSCLASPLLEKRQAPSVVSFAKASNALQLVSTPGNGARRTKQYGSAQLRDELVDVTWSVKVNIDGQQFQLQVDTDTSDTWVVHKGYQCFDNDGNKLPRAACAFGPVYTGTYQNGKIPNENFNFSSSTQYPLEGTLGYSDVTVAGIKVTNQTISLVDKVANFSPFGNNVTSGVLGLAYEYLEAAFLGSDPTQDNITAVGNTPGAPVFYPPIMQTMIAQGLNPPLFSIALQRSTSLKENQPGGYMAFGGLPPVNVDPGAFVSTPILTHQYTESHPARDGHKTFYTITVDGYVYNNKKGNAKFHSTGEYAEVDSYTTFSYLPTDVLNGYLASFPSPPPYYAGAYNVPCGSTAPPLGVKIAGTVFNISSDDIVFRPSPYNSYVNSTDGLTYCTLGVADNGPPLTVLGTVFMKNVVAVFDVGNSVMRFAPHNY